MFEKNDQALIIIRDGDRHNFDLETLTTGKLMLVLGLFDVSEQRNLQINYISRLLTALYIPSILSFIPICQ